MMMFSPLRKFLGQLRIGFSGGLAVAVQSNAAGSGLDNPKGHPHQAEFPRWQDDF